MNIRTKIRAGGVAWNRNAKARLVVRTKLRAGGAAWNRNAGPRRVG